MNNPPAFPLASNWLGELRHLNGMTLRDYFAAKAIQGICASGPALEWSNDRLAAEAYAMADKMLAARENK
jgi:hypothetical protein